MSVRLKGDDAVGKGAILFDQILDQGDQGGLHVVAVVAAGCGIVGGQYTAHPLRVGSKEPYPVNRSRDGRSGLLLGSEVIRDFM